MQEQFRSINKNAVNTVNQVVDLSSSAVSSVIKLASNAFFTFSNKSDEPTANDISELSNNTYKNKYSINDFCSTIEKLKNQYPKSTYKFLATGNTELIKSILRIYLNAEDSMNEEDYSTVKKAREIREKNHLDLESEAAIAEYRKSSKFIDDYKILINAFKIRNKVTKYKQTIDQLNSELFDKLKVSANKDEKLLYQISRIEYDWNNRKYFAACPAFFMTTLIEIITALSSYAQLIKQDLLSSSNKNNPDIKILHELYIQLQHIIRDEKNKIAQSMVERIKIAERKEQNNSNAIYDDIVLETLEDLNSNNLSIGLNEKFIRDFKNICLPRYSLTSELLTKFREFVISTYCETLFSNQTNREMFLKKIRQAESETQNSTIDLLMQANIDSSQVLASAKAEEITDNRTKDIFTPIAFNLLTKNATYSLSDMNPVEKILSDTVNYTDIIIKEGEAFTNTTHFTTNLQKLIANDLVLESIVKKVRDLAINETINESVVKNAASSIASENKTFFTAKSALISFLTEEVNRVSKENKSCFAFFMVKSRTRHKIDALHDAINAVKQINSMETLIKKSYELRSDAAITIKRNIFGLFHSTTDQHYSAFLATNTELRRL